MNTEHSNNTHLQKRRTWLVRAAFALVFIWNIQCAVSFVLFPQSFAAAYELSGESGQAAIRGLGIAFLMWNATYPPVIWNPHGNRTLALVVLAQQTIGLAGESCLLFTLPAGHAVLAASIARFIAFDAAGLILMLVAWCLFATAKTRAD